MDGVRPAAIEIKRLSIGPEIGFAVVAGVLFVVAFIAEGLDVSPARVGSEGDV